MGSPIPAGVDINPEVVRAMAAGWAYQARRKARFLEWLRSDDRTGSPCRKGYRVVLEHPTPEAGVLACVGYNDADGDLLWPGAYLEGELGIDGPEWKGRSPKDQDLLETAGVLASPQWAAIFEGVEGPGGSQP